MRAQDVSSALLALAEEVGQPRLRWHATYYAAGLAQLTGTLEKSPSGWSRRRRAWASRRASPTPW